MTHVATRLYRFRSETDEPVKTPSVRAEHRGMAIAAEFTGQGWVPKILMYESALEDFGPYLDMQTALDVAIAYTEGMWHEGELLTAEHEPEWSHY